MTYDQAIEKMKRGAAVVRAGKTFRLFSRGVFDVTDPEVKEHVYMSDDDRKATDWEAVAE